MHQILIDYYKKFATKEPKRIEKFFTGLNLDECFTSLPYIYDVEVFCLRLLKAYLSDEKICIYSDYDTDAVTATASMFWGLNDLGFNSKLISFYAPDRFTESYGMNP